MKLSHSKLNTILTCPMSYYLSYKQGISLQITKPALSIGSMAHWGIEHNTEDLSGYYNEEGNFKQRNNYTKDEVMAESMVHGYLTHKDEIFKEILNDGDKQLELLDEQHEISIFAKIPSHIKGREDHQFMGIIDLLLLTEKGFIIVDYKTSSITPDWDKYLDQLYRYVMLINHEFPGVPVYRIAIINLKKSQIRLRQNENEESFKLRLRQEYDINEGLINSHIFDVEKLDQLQINRYIDNLSDMADFAQNIEDNHYWFINYNNANSIYGKSDYYDIIYQTPGCELYYKIKDHVWNDDEQKFVDTRLCVDIDMKTIFAYRDTILNKYDLFKKEYDKFPKKDKILFFEYLKQKWITNDELLEIYWETLVREEAQRKNEAI